MVQIARIYPAVDEQLLEDLRRAGYRRIALQLPAGLTPASREIAERIEHATRARVTTMARACFGACDPPSPPESGAAEALVALGHAAIPNMRVDLPTYLVEMRVPEANVEGMASLVLEAKLPRRLGAVASIQHIGCLAQLQEALRARGVGLKIGTGGKRLSYPGQALGCNYSSATSIEGEVEGFLFLGTGQFHPIGLVLSVQRPVWSLDPLQMRLEGPADRQALVNRRLLEVERAMDAKTWGVLVSTFPGQSREGLAGRLVERARARGKDAFVISFDRLNPADLVGQRVDAYVSTACPRIAIDDGHLYERPVLTPSEFLSAIGDTPLTPYRFDIFP